MHRQHSRFPEGWPSPNRFRHQNDWPRCCSESHRFVTRQTWRCRWHQKQSAAIRRYIPHCQGSWCLPNQHLPCSASPKWSSPSHSTEPIRLWHCQCHQTRPEAWLHRRCSFQEAWLSPNRYPSSNGWSIRGFGPRHSESKRLWHCRCCRRQSGDSWYRQGLIEGVWPLPIRCPPRIVGPRYRIGTQRLADHRQPRRCRCHRRQA